MWNVMCNVSEIRINVDTKQGCLFLPEMNYPDMSSTIRCFTSVDPEIEVIETFVDGKPDTMYIKIDGEWQAIVRKQA